MSSRVAMFDSHPRCSWKGNGDPLVRREGNGQTQLTSSLSTVRFELIPSRSTGDAELRLCLAASSGCRAFF